MENQIVKILLKAVYFLLHAIFTLYEIIYGIYTICCIKLLDICHEFSLFKEKCVKLDTFEKIPKHLTVMLGHEEPSPHDLANLILWSLTVGISFISFYDYKGNLTHRQEEIQDLVSKKLKKSDRVIWHSPEVDTHENGYVARTIHVKVLNENDGKATVAALTKQWSISGESDFSVENVDIALAKQFEFPDPDFAMSCGKGLCLYGYPPWQIRATELTSIKSHHNISFDTFLDSLEVFSKSEQRHGK